jgi:ketosteroid isomerase-like protein
MTQTSEGEERGAAERASELSDQRILRMTPDGLSGSPVETVLRARLEEMAQAIRDKDLERLLARYSPDVVAFDLRPPLDARGRDACRRHFEQWFGSFDGPLGFELHRLRMVPGDVAAFCHYLGLVTGARPGGRLSGYWVRGTTCFERRDGEWLVTHEHISLPQNS